MMNRRFQNNEKIGDYRICGFIGRGGMGEVYHAIHDKLNRSVAIKVLSGMTGVKESYKSRFLNEARLQASLHHPNIATLYDFQEVNDQLYIFMEFVDGECLEDLIERNFFSVDESLKVFESIVAAISFVHSHGIIHRDIKAENIKLTSSGVAKLLDFGIAKDALSQNLTRIGGVIGTPNYLAPEQLEGQPATPQTDIWALGVLLYKMLTGFVPFESERFESLQLRIIQANFTSPEDINPAVPPTVSNIVKKCLAKDTARRYQTADELISDVQAALKKHYSEEKYVEPKTSENQLFPLVKIGGLTVSLLLFLGLVFAGIWAIGGSKIEPADVNKSPVEKTKVENMDKVVPIDKKNKPAIAQTDPGNDRKTIRIDTTDGPADVFRSDQKLGTTPYMLEGVVNETVYLTLRRKGFEDKHVIVEFLVGKKVYTYTLTTK